MNRPSVNAVICPPLMAWWVTQDDGFVTHRTNGIARESEPPWDGPRYFFYNAEGPVV